MPQFLVTLTQTGPDEKVFTTRVIVPAADADGAATAAVSLCRGWTVTNTEPEPTLETAGPAPEPALETAEPAPEPASETANPAPKRPASK